MTYIDNRERRKIMLKATVYTRTIPGTDDAWGVFALYANQDPRPVALINDYEMAGFIRRDILPELTAEQLQSIISEAQSLLGDN
jgi:hypothetical protein